MVLCHRENKLQKLSFFRIASTHVLSRIIMPQRTAVSFLAQCPPLLNKLSVGGIEVQEQEQYREKKTFNAVRK